VNKRPTVLGFALVLAVAAVALTESGDPYPRTLAAFLGLTRLYVLRLTHNSTPTPVPWSTARLYARTAWSPGGAWLFCQGRGGRLRALEIATARTYPLGFRCCRYTAMVAIRSR
jgi:hypothetical protein